MSLRIRLTLLYTSLLGGILLLFGAAVYSLVNVVLVIQIDDVLDRTHQDILAETSITALGGVREFKLPDLDVDTSIFVQVWSRNGNLQRASINIDQLREPMDPLGLQATRPIFRDVVLHGVRMRMLSVPLTVADRQVGTLQVGTSLAKVDSIRQVLFIVLIVVTVLALIVAVIAGYISTRSALSPLESVTQTAMQITRADDLSRRIPDQATREDEVGQLIQAFNQTLERLEHLFISQRRFLADVGHELRTPLTVIQGNIDLLRRMDDVDEESLESIENEVARLTRLVGDLLLLAQAESGKLPLDRSLVELDTIFLEVFQQAQILAQSRLTIRIGEIDQVLVCGDGDRLKQVMLNLVSNSIKYTPEGGEIVIGLGKTENLARIVVSDNGSGIPAKDIPFIFERFYRGEQSRVRSSNDKGFGLGLSIAYWIVKNHGGRIEVDSQEGQGTNFCVWLPLAVGDCVDMEDGLSNGG